VLDRTNLFVRDQAAGRNPWVRREWHYLVCRSGLRRCRRHTRAALGLVASAANQNNKEWQDTNYRWKTSRHSLIVAEETAALFNAAVPLDFGVLPFTWSCSLE
jgi:hypothetical protein